MRILISVPLISLLFTSGLWADCSYVVATSGSDLNPGTAGAPWATPQHAVQAATAGSSVCFRGGTWNLSSNVVITKPLTLQAWPGEAPVFSAPVAGAVGEVIFVGASNVTIGR